MDEQTLNRLNTDRLQSRQVDELVGLARGLIADGSINQAEVEFLEKWLVANLSVSQQPLIATLYDRVGTILSDGVADPEECDDLFAALSAFTAGDAVLGEAPKSASLPLCQPAPPVRFEGMAFCFTGTFSFGQRKHCEEAVASRGGTGGSLTKATNYLVIGAYATESWKHSSFGNKIIKAAEMRSTGIPISIIAEEHWASRL
ncbi:BRCT domain-containing protein [Pacificimonas flava]|uniref:NAD-dependent DNA ligase n=1 Tax=Pacificimonas flava TaxID=1234595 RepID=M2U1R7_9SPHN|nr:BRCT domain-containing protein [Pacificimonas flava]EMD81922.1 NAD-dependent DNA ligase [Pacificimonas flava]MBB5281546.1 NAD-dependent DNA ligase [Pacificimonas flava]